VSWARSATQVALLWLAAAAAPQVAPAADCSPAEGLHFICGPVATEDLVQVPATRWLLGSGLNVGQPARLQRIDTRRRTARLLQPQWQGAAPVTPDCTRPPDPQRWSTDGLAVLPGRHGRHRLYVANHGDRPAIELFDLRAGRDGPAVQWIGCVQLPADTLPNAVVALPDGGLIVLSFHDPQDSKAWQRMARGEDTGRLFEWHPGGVLQPLPNGQMSGGNGLALSADGHWLYASAWSGRRLVLLSRRDGTRRELALDFLPDNLKVLADGSLLVAGQRTTVERIAACAGPRCPQPWVVARIDIPSGSVHELASGPGSARIDYATGALQLDGTLYITARSDDRIAYLPVP